MTPLHGRAAVIRTAAPALLSVMLFASRATAQDPGIVAAPPAPSTYAVTQNVPYRTVDGVPLKLDIYTPRSVPPIDAAGAPVVVMYNGFASDGIKNRSGQVGWSRLLASRGFVVIGYDSHRGGEVEDFDSVTAFIKHNARAYGASARHIAMMAWSGHATRGMGVAMDPDRSDVKAAVILYGIGAVPVLRVDAPLLMIRAGMDNPRLNRSLDDFVARALKANAPVTVANYSSGLHAFDELNDNDLSRALIDQVASFLRTHTTESVEVATREGLTRTRAAAAFMAADWPAAVSLYDTLVRGAPSDVTINLRLGEALLGDRQYARALDVLQRTWVLDEGAHARDIGYPAASAAAQLNDFAKAEPFLKAMMARGFTKENIAADPAFAAFRSHPGFIALVGNGGARQ